MSLLHCLKGFFFVVVVVFNTIGLFKEMITCYLCVQPTALYMEMGELLRPLAAEPQLNRCQGLQGTWAAQWPAHWPGSPSLSPRLSCPLGEGLLTLSAASAGCRGDTGSGWVQSCVCLLWTSCLGPSIYNQFKTGPFQIQREIVMTPEARLVRVSLSMSLHS